jgi:hypothetical protein
VQVFIGGISANVTYAGRSQFPGLDQINVVILPNVPPGCFVSVVAMTGWTVSNAVTIPVSASGGACSDATTGLSVTQIQSFATKTGGRVNSMLAVLGQTFRTDGSSKGASALVLEGALGSSIFGTGYEYVSQGSCTIVPPNQGDFSNVITPLDAGGAIQVNTPSGQVNLGTGPRIYQAQVGATLTPGTYTFTGSGGANVKNLTATVNVTAPINPTNPAVLNGTITRSQGVTVTWSGGPANGAFQIDGDSGAPAVKFFCYAPASAGQFVIPSSILLALPAGPGSLTLTSGIAGPTHNSDRSRSRPVRRRRDL